nr:VCBS repeat-containing protein [Aquimarina aggregata]
MNNMLSKWLYVVVIVILSIRCQQKQNKLFHLAPSKKSNISFQNTSQPTQKLTILDYLYYYNGGGIAIGDINNDDLPDLFFTGNQVQNKLYLNKEGFQFEDITDNAGIGGNSHWNTGVTMIDVN